MFSRHHFDGRSLARGYAFALLLICATQAYGQAQREQCERQYKPSTVGQPKKELTHGELRGSEISLMFSEADIHTRVKGQVHGDRIEAQVTRNSSTSEFIGTRQ